MKIYEIPWLKNSHTLTLFFPVSELSEYRIRSLLGQPFSFAKVRARDSHGNPCYAQVKILENSSYIVIIDQAPYLLGSQ